MPTHYADRLQAAVELRGAPIVVGLDPVLEKLPAELRPTRPSLGAAVRAIEGFGRGVIEAVASIAPAVKMNVGFFEPFQAEGLASFFRLVEHAHAHDLLVIADIKRGDIGSTAALYARGWLAPPVLEDLSPTTVPDAVTLSGYLGENSVRPFIDAARDGGRGLYVLVRPSDPGADQVHDFGGQRRFYQHMADLVDRWGADVSLLGRCGLSLVGAVVAPKDAASTTELRSAMPRTPWLVPGYGAQGATARECGPCFLPGGRGALVNASRSVIYAYEPDHADWRARITAAAGRFRDELAGVAAAC